MVDISHETAEQTDRRLRRLFPSTRIHVFDEPYAFFEFGRADFPGAVLADALAIVRDDECWSQLAPARGGDGEQFTIFSFHFPDGMDNSGFVGWLASHLKQTFGTGVFVICGQNSKKGGIYDYWGCPIELAGDVRAELEALRTTA